MTVLAIESSGPVCAAAIWRGDRVVAARAQPLRHGHAAALMPLVQAVAAEAGLAWPDLTAIAVTVGPGSFTGIRVGLAAARGLGLALDRPVLGVTSFDALAASVPPERRAGLAVAVVIDSGRASRFVQGFDAALAPLGPPASVELSALDAALPPGPCLVVASGPLPADAAGPRPVLAAVPDAAVLAALAGTRLAAGGSFLPASPLYLRPPDAAVPRAGGRLRS